MLQGWRRLWAKIVALPATLKWLLLALVAAIVQDIWQRISDGAFERGQEWTILRRSAQWLRDMIPADWLLVSAATALALYLIGERGKIAAAAKRIAWRLAAPWRQSRAAGDTLVATGQLGPAPPPATVRPAGPVGPVPVLQDQPKRPGMVADDANKLTQALRGLSDGLQESVRSHSLLHYFRGWRANLIGQWPVAGVAAAEQLAQMKQKIGEARALFGANNDLASRIYVGLGRSFRDDFAPFINGYHDKERDDFFAEYEQTLTAFERNPSIDNDTLPVIASKTRGAAVHLERYLEFVNNRVSEIDAKIREIRSTLARP
jgi:hypothetical protein